MEDTKGKDSNLWEISKANASLFNIIVTAFLFKKWHLLLIFVGNSIIFAHNDAEAPLLMFHLVVHFEFFMGGFQ